MSFIIPNINHSLYINHSLHLDTTDTTDTTDSTDSTELESLKHWWPTVVESEWFKPLALITILSIGVALALTTPLRDDLLSVIALVAYKIVEHLRKSFLAEYAHRVDRLPIKQAIHLQFYKHPTPWGINQKHLAHTLQSEEKTIIIPNGCNLDNIPLTRLTELFNAMNTTIKVDQNGSIRTDYVDPNSPCIVTADSTPLNYRTVRQRLYTLVCQIKNRLHIRGLDKQDAAKQDFYDKIETLLKVIIYEIQSGKEDASLYNDVIFQCATAVHNCAGRYIAVLSEEYERLTSHIPTDSFEDLVLEELHQMRRGIVLQITNNHPLARSTWLPHIFIAHMINLGLARGIHGSKNTRFLDSYYMPITQAASLKAFDRIYTPQHIQEYFEEMVNGAQTTETGNQKFITNNLPVGKQSTIEWLGNHVPLDWSPSIRKAINQTVPLTPEQIESLFGPAFDEEEKNKATANPQYQPLTGIHRLQQIRARMFQIACTTTVGGGNLKPLGCTYVLTQLGVLNSDIDWTQLHMDTDALNTLFSYDDNDLHQAGIRF